jgi:hypothetical protein
MKSPKYVLERAFQKAPLSFSGFFDHAFPYPEDTENVDIDSNVQD